MALSSEHTVIGLREIADLLEVDRRTPHAWQYRKVLPRPDHPSVNGLRAWDRETIVDWAARTGRAPESLRGEVAALGVEVAEVRGGRAAVAEVRSEAA